MTKTSGSADQGLHAASSRALTIETPYGRLRGTLLDAIGIDAADHAAAGIDAAARGDGAVAQFLGIPYAAPPVGPLRLRSPIPPGVWSGVRDALTVSAPSLQTLKGNQTWLYEPLPPTSEDCLYLNVWTPDVRAHLPVLVWFHGGATRNGHGGAGAFNGARLARRGGLVVVTVSYRLGALGGLAHPDLADPTTGYCANWGLQDKIAALRWVRECAHAFGGDAENITVAGQSSGGANAALMAQSSEVRGLFQRVVLQSPPLFQPPMFADLADAAEYTEILAESLGVRVNGLPGVDGLRLFEAENVLIRSADVIARMGRPRTAPVRDGLLVKQWSYHADAHDLPLLAGWTRDEARFWYDLRDGDGTVLSPLQAPQTDEGLDQQVAALIRLYYPFADAPASADVVATYRRSVGTADPDGVWNEVYTDLVFRAPIAHHVGDHAAAGSPTFAYEFDCPLPPPGRGTPHAADVPFVFGNISHPHVVGKVGRGPEVQALSLRMMDLWASFAHTGRPSAAGVELWEEWHPEAPAVLVIAPQTRDRQAGLGVVGAGPPRSVPLPRSEQLACWPAFAGGTAVR